MTGPEHYQKAKQLLDTVAKRPHPITPAESQEDANTVAAAQVHATLAQAAAVAVAGRDTMPANDWNAWMNACYQK